ncbi:MAG: hypothetical protein RIS52_2140 [Pseudomonadota bacterium]|jgi:hypothetical protein
MAIAMEQADAHANAAAIALIMLEKMARTGRYFIKASALTLLYDGGTREIYSMFQESAGKEIWLDDQMYRPASSE